MSIKKLDGGRNGQKQGENASTSDSIIVICKFKNSICRSQINHYIHCSNGIYLLLNCQKKRVSSTSKLADAYKHENQVEENICGL